MHADSTNVDAFCLLPTATGFETLPCLGVSEGQAYPPGNELANADH